MKKELDQTKVAVLLALRILEQRTDSREIIQKAARATMTFLKTRFQCDGEITEEDEIKLLQKLS